MKNETVNIKKLIIKTYGKVAEKYLKKYYVDPLQTKHLKKFVTLLPKNANILDAGCGPGRGVKFFIENGFQAIGIDISDKMLEIARKKTPNGIFKKMNMENLEFENNSFDAIWSAYSLIHVEKKKIKKVLSEFKRVLKEDGIIFMIVFEGRGEKIIPDFLDPNEKLFFNYFQKKELENLLKSKGFEIIKSTVEIDMDKLPVITLYAKL